MFTIYLVPLLCAMIFGMAHTLELKGTEEGSCINIKNIPTMDVDPVWLDSLHYIVAGSKFHLYRQASIHPRFRQMREDEFYYDACLVKNTSIIEGNGSVFGFGGNVLGSFDTEPSQESNAVMDAYPNNRQTGLRSDYFRQRITLTDYRTFAIAVNCWMGTDQKSWVVYSFLPKLDMATERLIMDHVQALGFKKENFVFLRYGNCENLEEIVGGGNRPRGSAGGRQGSGMGGKRLDGRVGGERQNSRNRQEVGAGGDRQVGRAVVDRPSLPPAVAGAGKRQGSSNSQGTNREENFSSSRRQQNSDNNLDRIQPKVQGVGPATISPRRGNWIDREEDDSGRQMGGRGSQNRNNASGSNRESQVGNMRTDNNQGGNRSGNTQDRSDRNESGNQYWDSREAEHHWGSSHEDKHADSEEQHHDDEDGHQWGDNRDSSNRSSSGPNSDSKQQRTPITRNSSQRLVITDEAKRQRPGSSMNDQSGSIKRGIPSGGATTLKNAGGSGTTPPPTRSGMIPSSRSGSISKNTPRTTTTTTTTTVKPRTSSTTSLPASSASGSDESEGHGWTAP